MPECEFGENDRNIPYNQPWLDNAIPSSNGKFDNCHRYAPKNWGENSSGQCTADMFDTSMKIPCNEFIYATDERNIQTEVTAELKFKIILCSQDQRRPAFLLSLQMFPSLSQIMFSPANSFNFKLNLIAAIC